MGTLDGSPGDWPWPVKKTAAQNLLREVVGNCNCSDLTCIPPG